MKWEYIVRHVHGGETMESSLNDLGMDSWELVSFQLPNGGAYYICVLKRLVTNDKPARAAKRQ